MIKKTVVTSFGKVAEKLQPSYVVGENIKWPATFEKQAGTSLKMLSM
jgi:hypothetical protein